MNAQLTFLAVFMKVLLLLLVLLLFRPEQPRKPVSCSAPKAAKNPCAQLAMLDRY